MAISGFEGYEKRLELHFFGDDPTQAQKKALKSGPIGLRQLDFDTLQQVLDEVQCTVVSALATWQLDSYVLSESSLFVYPNKVIIKTCGTTQLLKSVRPLVHHAAKLGLTLISLRYTRGDFIFPDQQPFPHTSFHDEIFFLNTVIPANLIRRKASVMDSWNVFSAAINDEEQNELDEEQCTIEICMTELDRSCAERFYLKEGSFAGGDYAGRGMTEISGIGRIVAGDDVCDYAFDPCGYSMNSIDLFGRYSTVHVTPEEGFSYASFETVVFSGAGKLIDGGEIARVVRGVERVFRPAKMSVAVTGGGEIAWRRVAEAMEIAGMKRRSWTADEFPAAGDVVFQTFASRRNP